MPNTLRLKSSLSMSEINTLVEYIYNTARSAGVQILFDLESAKRLVKYVVEREVGSFGRGGSFPTTLSNGVFAGLLQTGVDGLIEANASTKNASMRKLCPISWAVFPEGIHPMYTMNNRAKALKFHRELVGMPSNVAGTVTDSMVSIARFLDQANRAYAQFTNYLHRIPSQVEVYMYHMFGWPKMDAFVRVKGGRGTSKDQKVVSTMPSDLARQSNEVKRLVSPILNV